ncbi:MAG: adenylyltransferase/cytidyltransferase family protein [Chlamydiia bacterium]|nr:adenylyltransferase/cytidyltransferase family protein [Chlamydiia bacterium]
MKQILYPGTFDPPTMGHLNIIMRAAKIFDQITIGVGTSLNKKKPAFSPQERVELLGKLIKDFSNIKVTFFSGLLYVTAK